jgi:hypothetical protein
MALLADPAEFDAELESVVPVERDGMMLLIGAVITSVFLPAALRESAVGYHPLPVGCPGD